MASSKKPAAGRPHIKWDEETIALHDLDRGTRMKIEEPNTPYHYYAGEADTADVGAAEASIEITDVAMEMHNADPTNALKPVGASSHVGFSPASPAHSASNGKELQLDELNAKLTEHQERSEWDSDCSSNASSSSARNRNKMAKTATKDFSQKRKQHYNEYERMKQWRLQHAAAAADDDDDDA
ncbi:Aste57867_3478 [Aphanomyces stellatus]|uniref:Aste57867_3478 protein n=1 Tax=Aphanomyces stellatus TaxID=120398 RepID=A0A485KAL6_9STRA|nr:hypothetical protein As57867_003468 [Aphanomyces stellatus]VFT80643.1 Aste57867_3478 [Aphanomyces stellatus]